MERYTYSISTQTLNGVVVAGKLHRGIEASVMISEQLLGVSTDSDDCHCDFFDTLTAPEIAELNSILAAHDGIPALEPDEPEGQVSHYNESLAPTSTTDDTIWTDKLQLDIDPVDFSGRYKISFSALVGIKSRTARIRCRIRYMIIGDVGIERKVMDFGTQQDAHWIPYVGHFGVDLNQGDRFRIQIQFRTTSSGKEVGMRDTNLTAHRIGE